MLMFSLLLLLLLLQPTLCQRTNSYSAHRRRPVGGVDAAIGIAFARVNDVGRAAFRARPLADLLAAKQLPATIHRGRRYIQPNLLVRRRTTNEFTHTYQSGKLN